jgi:hypothetical protein
MTIRVYPYFPRRDSAPTQATQTGYSYLSIECPQRVYDRRLAIAKNRLHQGYY